MREYWKEPTSDWLKDPTVELLKVKKIQLLEKYKLKVWFSSGDVRIFNASKLFQFDVYSKLKDPDFFGTAKADGYSISWNDNIDISPENVFDLSVPNQC